MKIIKSSDIANYLFCPVSWWIGITKGVKITKTMNKGEKHHVIIAENQPRARFLYICMTITVVIIIALIIYRFLG
jgi:CRISPR/Cas system-associated exonuclease Cas4 (RecB family)